MSAAPPPAPPVMTPRSENLLARLAGMLSEEDGAPSMLATLKGSLMVDIPDGGGGGAVTDRFGNRTRLQPARQTSTKIHVAHAHTRGIQMLLFIVRMGFW